MKKFLKNLSFDTNYKLLVPAFMYKIIAHNISAVRNKVVFLSEGL